LEYGKDNYWTGEKLLKQIVEKAIPTFEAAFPGYTASSLITQQVMVLMHLMHY